MILKNKVNINRLLFLVSILLFMFFSIKALYFHSLHFDEVHAWNIAADLNFFDILKLEKYEGHLFIWHAILMPFAKNNLFFPYSLQIINWLFAFLAILVMWRYAPFNSFAKAGITLSIPFQIYSLFARCYSIGILLLFCAAALYKKRLKHPYIYSLVLISAANTSVMAAAGAFALGCLFLFDLAAAYKYSQLSRKNIIISLLILFAGGAAVLLQLGNFVVPEYVESSARFNFYQHFLKFYIGEGHFVNIVYVLVYSFLLLFSAKFFDKAVKPGVFLIITQGILVLIFSKIYAGECWHFCFLFIYFMIAIWLYCCENSVNTKFQKFYNIVFAFFCIMLIFYPYDYKIFNGKHAELISYMSESSKNFVSSKIFLFPNSSLLKDIIPFLKKYDIEFYDSHANLANSFEAYKAQWHVNDIDFEKIAGAFSNEDKVFIVTIPAVVNKQFKQKAAKVGLELIPAVRNDKLHYCIILIKKL